MIGANRIEAILVPGSASAKRLVKATKESHQYLDLTCGRMTKALILLDDGKLVGCALTPRTIAARIHHYDSDDNEGETDNESDEPNCPIVDA